MRLWIVQAERPTETSLSVYLSDGSTVEVTLDDVLWLRTREEDEPLPEEDSSKWD